MTSRSRLPRLLQVMAVALVALVLAGCLSGGQQSVTDSINWDRAINGRRTLVTHDVLNRKAQSWAEKLSRDGRLAHSTISSGLPSCWRSAGENVGYGSSVRAVEAAYMLSAGHRANILNTKWDYVGVGHAQRAGRIYTVQVFMQGCR